MDPEMDALIQKTIRSSFQDCTTLTIAHRLHTVLSSDRIMVLNQGQVRGHHRGHSMFLLLHYVIDDWWWWWWLE